MIMLSFDTTLRPTDFLNVLNVFCFYLRCNTTEFEICHINKRPKYAFT